MAVRPARQEKFGRVGVLMGGCSSERGISLKSGMAVYGALKEAGLSTCAIEISSEEAGENISLIKSAKIDCAFIALHGRFGEDGQIQEILEGLGVFYTGSGVSASKLAMDKAASRKIFQAHGLSAPRHLVVKKEFYSSGWKLPGGFNLPLVVKPVMQGSSIGLSIVKKEEELERALRFAFSFDSRIIIEEYIKGREMTVGILDKEALPVIEIIPKKEFFDYEAKYTSGMTEYQVPAKLKQEVAGKIKEAALSAHKSLGCFGCSRVDLILSRENSALVLEVNTIPGFTATSLLPKAAERAGTEFKQLCVKLVELAYEKT